MLYKTSEEAYRAYREAPDSFFERYHDRWFNEKDLISPEWSWYETKYHYNLVENAIIDLLRQHFGRVQAKQVLDVGSGTGHWIDFYLNYLEASAVTGLDFSGTCVRELRRRYEGRGNVRVDKVNVAGPLPGLEADFDVVNAIGVMFHIVDDAQWRMAVANLLNCLNRDGIAIVGGEFGPHTSERGVMRKHRSRQCWESVLGELGGRVLTVRYHDWFKGGVNDGLKNNLLAFVRT
jgi:SAM-dependent methyltransferase